MRRIIVKEVRPGMVAARSLASPQQPETPILPGGQTITLRHILAFHEQGVYDLWVNDPGLEFLDDVCCAQPTAAQQRLAEALRESFLRFAAHVPAGWMRRHETLLQELVEGMVRTGPVIPCFRAFTEDAELLAHSCDVAVLSAILGIQLEGYLIEQRRRLNGRQARDVLNLALGALFHDVGEVMLPTGQRESRLGLGMLLNSGGAGGGEDMGWRQHAAEGFAIARGRLDPSAAAILLQHHQHFDGTGFGGHEIAAGKGAAAGPAKSLAGAGIHVHARIVMAADVFCQLLFGDPMAGGADAAGVAAGRVPQPMVRALWHIQQMPVRQWFDPVVHGALMGLLPPIVEGMLVTLEDHAQGLVVKAEPAGTCYPEVQRIGGGGRGFGGVGEMDAHTGGDQDEPGDAAILAVDGSKVGEFLYGVRRSRPLVAA